ncbi:MAG: AAA family ATPase [Elusimicrobiota bacterium]|jgi:wobble nucleotide-excising tRNase|nr:AAA family ATPase [Elusimicrobiota bacterium]
MKIKKIRAIKNYKSFLDFSWSKFCKNASRQEVLGKFSIVFGENGAGKSAICNALKSVSQNQDFPNPPPTLVEIELNDDKTYKYENEKWTYQVNKNSFLFFDVDFISANVHTHGVRSSNLQQGAHTQKAGKLIIDLDEQANTLKEVVKAKEEELEALQTSYADILKKQFTDKENEFFKIYKDADDKTKQEKLAKEQEELKKLETDLTMLQKLNNKYAEINCLSDVDHVSFSNSLSSKETFTELFTRQIKEKAQDEADEAIKTHFAKHKQFIEYAKEQIPQNYADENCPLCMQPLANATKVIEYYRIAFDQTYENAKRQFLSGIETAKNELETIKTDLSSLPQKVTEVFDDLEKIKTNFEIQDIYKLEEKTKQTRKFSSTTTKEIGDLLTALESLKKIERERVDASKLYETVTVKIQGVEKSVKSVNDLITEKNKLINDFKGKYSDQSKITGKIQEKTKKQTESNELIDFLKSDKIKHIKNKTEALEKQKTLSDELKKAREDLKTYLANTIPASVISQMITILGKFNLSFTLEHITENTKTKDYSFSFKIKDQKGNEREMKDGLSEGERQLISLAFFFAINENLQNKENIVLVFDDPITSLDSPNLKILAELIHQKTQEFSQVIVFTHHPLFFKYLSKCENPNPSKFGVLKNADQFGGSFMFFDPGFDLVIEVQQCNQEISQNAQNGNLKPEEIALKYGQLLRLAIEKFIKNDLLMWDKEKKFDEITESLKQGKNKMAKLSNDDLEVITNMYKYCNYSNLLHADKETPSALSELMTHIDKFVKILNKAKI